MVVRCQIEYPLFFVQVFLICTSLISWLAAPYIVYFDIRKYININNSYVQV